MDWHNALDNATEFWGSNLPELDIMCTSEITKMDPLTFNYDDKLNPLALCPSPRSLSSSELDERPQTYRANKNHWSLEEDEQLEKLAKRHRNNWDFISLHFPNKSPEAIKKRWENKLNPNIKRSKWTVEDDNLILKLYEKYGGNWKKITASFKGRPIDAVKNRYYGTIKRKLATSKSGVEKKIPILLSSSEPIKFIGKMWSEDELIDSLLADPGKPASGNLELSNLSVSLENLQVTHSSVLVSQEELSSEAKRQKLKDLYAKMATLESFISQTKIQIENIEGLNT